MLGEIPRQTRHVRQSQFAIMLYNQSQRLCGDARPNQTTMYIVFILGSGNCKLYTAVQCAQLVIIKIIFLIPAKTTALSLFNVTINLVLPRSLMLDNAASLFS